MKTIMLMIFVLSSFSALAYRTPKERNDHEKALRAKAKHAQIRNMTRKELSWLIVRHQLTMESWTNVNVDKLQYVDRMREGYARTPQGGRCHFTIQIFSRTSPLFSNYEKNRWAMTTGECESPETGLSVPFSYESRVMDKAELRSIPKIEAYLKRGYSRDSVNDI